MYTSQQAAEIEAAKAANVAIKVTLPDGNVKEGIKGATTPLDIATSISAGLAKKAIVGVVNGEVWDMFRPLEGNCNLKICTFDDAEGKDVSVLLIAT
jgi:threonyl-tRNA synthetase